MKSTGLFRPDKAPVKSPEEIMRDNALRYRYAGETTFNGIAAVLNGKEKEYPLYDERARELFAANNIKGTPAITPENVHQIIDWAVATYPFPEVITKAAIQIERPILITGALSGTISPTEQI